MNVREFVEMVMPGIGERCGQDGGCMDSVDHECTAGSADGLGRCLDHCTCRGQTLAWTSDTRTQRAAESLAVIDPPDTVYVVCPTCHYERRAGDACGLPCV